MLVTCCFMKIKANSNLLLKKTMKCKIWIITFKIRHALTVFKTPGQYRNHKTIILELQCTNYYNSCSLIFKEIVNIEGCKTVLHLS